MLSKSNEKDFRSGQAKLKVRYLSRRRRRLCVEARAHWLQCGEREYGVGCNLTGHVARNEPEKQKRQSERKERSGGDDEPGDGGVGDRGGGDQHAHTRIVATKR